MLPLQLFANGLVTGCALAAVAISFSLFYATTRIFHVAHAGIYSLGGYVAWTLAGRGIPFPIALLLAMAVCAAIGAGIQHFLYYRLERRRATHLVVLIASLGALAVIQNLIAALYSPNILQFPGTWGGNVVSVGSHPPHQRAASGARHGRPAVSGGVLVRASHRPRHPHARRRLQSRASRDHPSAPA